ncbi:MAG: oligoribonuclease [Bdellovibrionales bacterium]|nr:oligoribonuclease [Bdellovibrionales bacterium]
MASSKKRLLWVDLEMTGLDEKVDHILEVAAIITDYELNEIGRKHYIVKQPQSVLDNMNDWCKKHHGDSGLTTLVPNGTPLAQVETEMVAWIKEHFGEKHGKDGAVLAGNSIHNDRRFIEAYMPALTATLHYRMVDVSSYKEVFRERWHVKFEKKNTHRAIDDLDESIAELKHYLSFVTI